MALRKLYIFMAVTFLNVVRSQGFESHLICKSVQDVFSRSPSDRPLSGSAQGPPGKRGVPGVKGETGHRGEKGDKGSPASVNYHRIEHVIERTTTEIVSCIRNGGYASNKNCFTIILAPANQEKAFQLCEKIGQKPADIYNLEEQNGIENFMRPATIGSYIEFWLGMTYQPSTNTLLWSNGTVVDTNLKWHPSYPRSDASHTGMMLQVRRDATTNTHGIWNYKSSHSVGGVICMKPIFV